MRVIIKFLLLPVVVLFYIGVIVESYFEDKHAYEDFIEMLILSFFLILIVFSVWLRGTPIVKELFFGAFSYSMAESFYLSFVKKYEYKYYCPPLWRRFLSNYNFFISQALVSTPFKIVTHPFSVFRLIQPITCY